MAVVESLTKPVGGLSALLDPFGDMVGVFHIDSTQFKVLTVRSEAKSTRVICMEENFFIQNSCVSCNSEHFNFFDLDFFPLALTFTITTAFGKCSRSSSTISDDREWSRRSFRPFSGHGG